MKRSYLNQSRLTLLVAGVLVVVVGFTGRSEGNRPFRPVFSQSDCRVTEEDLAQLAVDMFIRGLETGSEFYLRSSTTPAVFAGC